MIDEKEWQNFLLDCKMYKDKVDNLLEIQKEHDKRITSLEKENTETYYQYKEIMEKLNTLINTTIPTLSAEIQAIKDKPAKRLDTIVVAILSAIGGGIGGFLIQLFMK